MCHLKVLHEILISKGQIQQLKSSLSTTRRHYDCRCKHVLSFQKFENQICQLMWSTHHNSSTQVIWWCLYKTIMSLLIIQNKDYINKGEMSSCRKLLNDVSFGSYFCYFLIYPLFMFIIISFKVNILTQCCLACKSKGYHTVQNNTKWAEARLTSSLNDQYVNHSISDEQGGPTWIGQWQSNFDGTLQSNQIRGSHD